MQRDSVCLLGCKEGLSGLASTSGTKHRVHNRQAERPSVSFDSTREYESNGSSKHETEKKERQTSKTERAGGAGEWKGIDGDWLPKEERQKAAGEKGEFSSRHDTYVVREQSKERKKVEGEK
ncbi:hypothetical protein BDD12DRAFT_332021 [Trichophaea hybrida]|nr:hypothetical protein BDD12DRAFT_332021 [Trichophaea hybrida]